MHLYIRTQPAVNLYCSKGGWLSFVGGDKDAQDTAQVRLRPNRIFEGKRTANWSLNSLQNFKMRIGHEPY